MEIERYRNILWWVFAVLALLFGGVGFYFDGAPWAKWFFLLGGVSAFAGHILWLGKKRPDKR